MNTSPQLRTVHRLAIMEGAVFLGALILFLVIIGNTLVRINDNLGAIDSSAQSVDRSATSLPGLVDSITGSLESIDAAAKPIQGQLDQINAGLETTRGGLATAESNLSSIQGGLTHIESNLRLADGYAHRVDVGLVADNSLLATGNGQAVTALGLVQAVKADTGVIRGRADSILGHLNRIVTNLAA